MNNFEIVDAKRDGKFGFSVSELATGKTSGFFEAVDYVDAVEHREALEVQAAQQSRQNPAE